MSDRKYRQSGYQDDEPRESRRGGQVPRPQKDGPRGRGLGAPSASVFRCARCGRKQVLTEPLGVEATCAGCGDDLRTCTNCAYFDSGAPFECRQPVTERVAKKSKANECELFAPKETAEFDSDAGKPSDPKDAFDALFDF